MSRGPNRIIPPHRNGYHLNATGPGPDIPFSLRPQLYPGRDTNVFGGVSPDLVPSVLDGPIEFVTLPRV